LVRVARRAESSTARKCQAPLPFLTGAKLGSSAAERGDHQQADAVPNVARCQPRSRRTDPPVHFRDAHRRVREPRRFTGFPVPLRSGPCGPVGR
jgi:hypothetical protein